MSGADRLQRAYRFTVVPEHLIRDMRLDDRAFRLWCLLDRYAGAKDAAFPSRRTLAEDLGCSRESIDRSLKRLVDAGWLAKELREAGGTNLYTLLESSSSQVTPAPLVTSDEGGGASPMTQGVVTSDEGGAAPVTTPVVTHDAQKEPSQEPSPKDPGAKAPSGAKTRGTRLPADWEPGEGLRQWFREQPFSALVDPRAETETFKDYWTAQPGQKGVKVDWDATWRNWIRKTAERRGGNVRTLPLSDGDRARAAAFHQGSR